MTQRGANLGLQTTCAVLATAVLVSGCATGAAQTHLASTQAMSSSLRSLRSEEINQLISGHSVAPADIVGAGVEIFHEDGRYESHSRIILTGRYRIEVGLLCTRLDGSDHQRCRQILVDPGGNIYSLDVGDMSGPTATPQKIKIT